MTVRINPPCPDGCTRVELTAATAAGETFATGDVVEFVDADGLSLWRASVVTWEASALYVDRSRFTLYVAGMTIRVRFPGTIRKVEKP